jgi:hypothetical protein
VLNVKGLVKHVQMVILHFVHHVNLFHFYKIIYVYNFHNVIVVPMLIKTLGNVLHVLLLVLPVIMKHLVLLVKQTIIFSQILRLVYKIFVLLPMFLQVHL